MDVSVVCGKYNQSILHVLLSAPARMEKVEETDIVKFEKCLAAILKCDDGRLNPIINHKDDLGFVPLHHATDFWPEKITLMLLERGAMASIGIQSKTQEKPINSISFEVRINCNGFL